MLIPKLSTLVEYKRPWKLFTLICGISLLIVGAYLTPAPDWDVPVSLIMAILTYLTAPWGMRVLLTRDWKFWPLMLFWMWFSVDGAYAVYWYFKDPAALELMRSANFPASLSLYGLCGIIWLYQGSLKQLFSEFKAVISKKEHP
jgi:hypothetical protein